MIHESSYWKEPLLESAKKFKEFELLSEIDDATYVEIEKAIFIGFYSIRKLLESETKVTDSLKLEKRSITWFGHIGDEVTWRNSHKLDQLYDFDRSNSEDRILWFIASRIIHSFIFDLCINENGGLSGIPFTSDSDKNEKLYELSINGVIDIFELVGNNYVETLEWYRCEETGEEHTRAT